MSDESMLLFKPVTKENWRECVKLELEESQTRFVATNWASIIEGFFEEEFYPTCIYVNEVMVGFLMYGRDPDTNRMEVSRLMIDKKHQGKGYGKAAVIKLLQIIKSENGSIDFYTCAEPDNTMAISLYESLGFEKTGEIMWDEIVLKISL